MKIEDHFANAHQTTSNVFKHCKAIKEFASKCSSIAEIGLDSPALTISLLAGAPRHYMGYAQSLEECQSQQKLLESISCDTECQVAIGISLAFSLGVVDLLVLNTSHTYTRLRAELNKYAPSVLKYIVIPQTYAYGDRGQDGHTPGVSQAILEFSQTNSNWQIVYNQTINNGMTVLENIETIEPETERIYSMVSFDIPEVKWVERVTVGMIHPSTEYDLEQEAQRQLDKLNKSLRYGMIIGVERNFTVIKISDKEVITGYLVYHIGYKSRPLGT